ncbi:MAG: hypothetical protein IJN86_01900 [Clostridia bacterium]|nr:hypothetical protein [Clostridia bacterium]
MADNPKRNSEGYSDPTAYLGLRPIIQEENALERDVNMLIKVLKYIISKSGFELVSRIEIKDKKTGRVFK